MRGTLLTLIGIMIASIVVLLCFSSCYLATKSDKYWEEKKKELEKHNERH